MVRYDIIQYFSIIIRLHRFPVKLVVGLVDRVAVGVRHFLELAVVHVTLVFVRRKRDGRGVRRGTAYGQHAVWITRPASGFLYTKMGSA